MDRFTNAAKKIKEADAVIVGASNGFSISEGLHLFANNEKFRDNFGDFIGKYGFKNLLEGFFYPLNIGEKWAYEARVAKIYSLDYKTSPVMEAFKKVVEDKPCFIITSNGENHFELAGFENVFEIEGSWKNMRCSRGCTADLYSAWDSLKAIADAENGNTPKELIPVCPHCGTPMVINMAIDNGFIPDTKASMALNAFIDTYKDKNLLVLEMGIGWRNTMIKKPLMDLVASLPKASYITINKGEIYIPQNIESKSFGLDGDLTEMLTGLYNSL